MTKFQKDYKINLGRERTKDDLWAFRKFMALIKIQYDHKQYMDKYRKSEKGKIVSNITSKRRQLNHLKQILGEIDENFEKNYDMNTGNRLLNYKPESLHHRVHTQHIYIPINDMYFKRFMERIDIIEDFVRQKSLGN